MTLVRVLLVAALLWLPSSSSAQVIPDGGGDTAQTSTNTADIATNTAAIAAIGTVWTTPTFAAGEFTGNGSMTWTVEAGDVLTDAFVRIGNTVTYNLVVTTSTIGGTPSTLLLRDLPASLTPTTNASGGCEINDFTLRSSGRVFIDSAGTVLQIGQGAGATYSTVTDNATVNCTVTFEVDP